MKYTAYVLVWLAALTLTAPAVASGDHYNGPTLSGLATNALVRAYEGSGLDGQTPAPFRLEDYVVAVHTAGDYFQITFSASTSRDFHDFVLDTRTQSIIWTQGDPISKLSAMPAETEGYVLPGIVAGEIIVAYHEAVRENYKPLQTAAYAVNFEPFAGGLDIGFEKTQEPKTVSVVPAPTPSPGVLRCLSGCATGPGYHILVRDGRLTIQRHVSV
jgi:hypothetical protein